MTSPLEREILTHYYCYEGSYKGGSENWSSPVREAVERFIKLGLLIHMRSDAGYSTLSANRDALEPYMDALGTVPLPEQRWVVPHD